MTVNVLNNSEKTNTEILVDLLYRKVEGRLLEDAEKAFLNYLTVVWQTKDLPEVQDLVSSYGIKRAGFPLKGAKNLTPERAAFLNGFTAHFLDLDDAQAHFRGHPSAVIMSTLFAVTTPEDKLEDFLWAFIQGVELAGKFGWVLNPAMALQGWHTTGMIGTIAAAAALGIYKKLPVQQLKSLLSLAATQESGLQIEAGSNGKPFNAGMAARDAVNAYLFCQTGLQADLDPFSAKHGWFKTVAGIDFQGAAIAENWLKPAEIEDPGLWIKQHPFCSAAMSGYDAAKELYQRGIRARECTRVILHFPVGGDHALRFKQPRTGKEGKFSLEYIVWQVLNDGDVHDQYFAVAKVKAEFSKWQKRIVRTNDLPLAEITARPTKITVELKNGQTETAMVSFPLGSAQQAFKRTELLWKLRQQVLMSDHNWQQFKLLLTRKNCTVAQILQLLKDRVGVNK
ncbi:MmgE/PrpD family protein [Liquorilactobacillus satsumensis]|uniref:MmgE/PrpD family protein n=1 Tax=Liquorilactobacillus satsumensis TaxID=259059 RepID=UPI0021C424E4|nr:MmgE/PrpD family protein [Liquorilactobacillus satsumensis]MCP9311951.1 MmgE/PrpD family protein [Liquorilactobacillus satsumensis]MCP9359084.1 MmgE/PrpD family protein [Liquorilactobacillus satsumensis]